MTHVVHVEYSLFKGQIKPTSIHLNSPCRGIKSHNKQIVFRVKRDLIPLSAI